MQLRYEGHRGRAMLTVVAAVLAVTGVVAIVVAVRAQRHAPQPPSSVAGSYAAGPQQGAPAPSTTSNGRGATPTVRGLVLPRSVPTHLSIPAIGVDADLIQLGITSDRTLQVPPLNAISKAGWYRNSPAPGQLGPSIVLGHVDSATSGAGVFFKLGALRNGNTVSIRRADSTVAVFRIDAVAKYPKNHFPTLTVYGNTDHAALRLITCGGKFDLSAHSYESNIVAFASLVSTHKA
jgi:Sortase domain